MKRVFKFMTAVISVIGIQSSAFALINGEVLVGKRNYTLKPNAEGEKDVDLGATEFQAAVFLDPIPLVPVAFGAVLSSQTFEDKDSLKDMSALTAGLSVKAWFPLTDFEPYAKLTYIVYGKGKAKIDLGNSQSMDATYSISGLHLAAGLSWSPLPLVAILAEVDLGSADKWEGDDLTGVPTEYAGLFDKSDLDNDANSMGFLVGVQVGI